MAKLPEAMKVSLSLIFFLLELFGRIECSNLEVVYQWKYLDWVDPAVRLTGRNFTLGNPFTQDVDVDRHGRVFVTSPQWLHGTPIALSVLSNVTGPGGPLLLPYPNWKWHTAASGCDSIISVYRLAVNMVEHFFSNADP